jgi:hypothetical protein
VKGLPGLHYLPNRRIFSKSRTNITFGGGYMATKYGPGTQKKMEKVMHEFKEGTLKSGKEGKGGKVKSRKQAIAIGLSEAREAGNKVPQKSSKK